MQNLIFAFWTSFSNKGSLITITEWIFTDEKFLLRLQSAVSKCVSIYAQCFILEIHQKIALIFILLYQQSILLAKKFFCKKLNSKIL